jgi:hypothetical protein
MVRLGVLVSIARVLGSYVISGMGALLPCNPGIPCRYTSDILITHTQPGCTASMSNMSPFFVFLIALVIKTKTHNWMEHTCGEEGGRWKSG